MKFSVFVTKRKWILFSTEGRGEREEFCRKFDSKCFIIAYSYIHKALRVEKFISI